MISGSKGEVPPAGGGRDGKRTRPYVVAPAPDHAPGAGAAPDGSVRVGAGPGVSGRR